MSKEQDIVRDYRSIREDYGFNPSIFSTDDRKVAKIKFIIDHKLSQVDKTIILLYADCGSLRKLGHRLGLSHMTMHKEIQRIKNEILKNYGRM